VTETNTFHDIKKENKSKKSGELAIKIAAGDINASNEFVQINYRWLLFIVRNKFSRSNNHEDIAQDTFMLVINKLQQGAVNNPLAILGFLRTTAIHIGFEYMRKDKKFTSAIDQEMLDVIEDAKEDILSAIIWDDKISFVKQVISELKIQRDQDILIKFYFQDEDKKSICKQLDLSTEHFDRVLYRAKERLKQLIDKRDDDHNDKIHSSKKNKNKQKAPNNIMLKVVQYIKNQTINVLSHLCKQKPPATLGEH